MLMSTMRRTILSRSYLSALQGTQQQGRTTLPQLLSRDFSVTSTREIKAKSDAALPESEINETRPGLWKRQNDKWDRLKKEQPHTVDFLKILSWVLSQGLGKLFYAALIAVSAFLIEQYTAISKELEETQMSLEGASKEYQLLLERQRTLRVQPNLYLMTRSTEEDEKAYVETKQLLDTAQLKLKSQEQIIDTLITKLNSFSGVFTKSSVFQKAENTKQTITNSITCVSWARDFNESIWLQKNKQYTSALQVIKPLIEKLEAAELKALIETLQDTNPETLIENLDDDQLAILIEKLEADEHKKLIEKSIDSNTRTLIENLDDDQLAILIEKLDDTVLKALIGKPKDSNPKTLIESLDDDQLVILIKNLDDAELKTLIGKSKGTNTRTLIENLNDDQLTILVKKLGGAQLKTLIETLQNSNPKALIANLDDVQLVILIKKLESAQLKTLSEELKATNPRKRVESLGDDQLAILIKKLDSAELKTLIETLQASNPKALIDNLDDDSLVILIKNLEDTELKTLIEKSRNTNPKTLIENLDDDQIETLIKKLEDTKLNAFIENSKDVSNERKTQSNILSLDSLLIAAYNAEAKLHACQAIIVKSIACQKHQQELSKKSYEKARKLADKRTSKSTLPLNSPPSCSSNELAMLINGEAFLLNAMNNYSEAFTLHKRANQLMPDNPHVLSGLGVIHYKVGRYLAITEKEKQHHFDKAYGYFCRVEQLNPNNNFYVYRGKLLYAMGDLNAAMADFNKTLSFDPHHYEANYQKGKLLAAQDKTADAEKHFKRKNISLISRRGLFNKYRKHDGHNRNNKFYIPSEDSSCGFCSTAKK
jgi:Mg/Co/Ni transporter MgtE